MISRKVPGEHWWRIRSSWRAATAGLADLDAAQRAVRIRRDPPPNHEHTGNDESPDIMTEALWYSRAFGAQHPSSAATVQIASTQQEKDVEPDIGGVGRRIKEDGREQIRVTGLLRK